MKRRPPYPAPFAFALALATAAPLAAQVADTTPVAGPDVIDFRVIGGDTLRLHVFRPDGGGSATALPALLVFHGGGWNVGAPEWMYGTSRWFAARGLVTVSAQYRLSDQATTTPLDAIDDARAAIAWVRAHADRLGVDPARVAAFGVSAGSHLAASAAVLSHGGHAGVPDALVLWSPAVDLSGDGWFERLLLGRAAPEAASPAHAIARRPPPALLLVGAEDLVTPPAGSRRFCAAALDRGGDCTVRTYEGVGHLFTRRLDYRSQEQGPFDTDPDALADSRAAAIAFLARVGVL